MTPATVAATLLVIATLADIASTEYALRRGLSASGNAPATHYISAGPISSEMAALLPCKSVTTDAEGNQQITTTPGHPELIPALALKAGITVTPAQITALYAAIDVSDQEPFGAMARLGLQIVQLPIQ